MLCYALSTIAAVGSAIAAIGGATVAGISASNQARQGRTARKDAGIARAKAETEANSQAREQRTALMKQNQQEPDIAALIAQAEQQAGGQSTFLTGQQGTAGTTGQLGRTKLLGQ